MSMMTTSTLTAQFLNLKRPKDRSEQLGKSEFSLCRFASSVVWRRLNKFGPPRYLIVRNLSLQTENQTEGLR
ncbi:MAG: hypothetical protein QOD75_4035 [Blastocatellia bacterium]|nr:hypothetical protein [Blastocatellia bacterium]